MRPETAKSSWHEACIHSGSRGVTMVAEMVSAGERTPSKRVLVTWGSKRGGTAEIGRTVAETLAARGFDVTAAPAGDVKRVEGYDAAIVGGALYANRWARSARRFVNRNVEGLRAMPVWFFSSGPLDDTADKAPIAATKEVAVLAERIGAKGHVTFGGRLEPDARGFPASAMAKKMSGDWRNTERIGAWAEKVADVLPDALPGTPMEHEARSRPRLIAHGVVGWLLCGVTMAALMSLASPTLARTLHALAAVVIFAGLAAHYFGARGAREPFETALTWAGLVALLDVVVVSGVITRSFEMFTSVLGTWLPLALIFLITWTVGSLAAAMSPAETREREREHERAAA